MNVKFEWHGDELMRRINQAVERVSGQVSLADLMPADFVRAHTRFATLDEMVTASKLMKDGCTEAEAAATLQSPEWDQFVSANSDFGSWHDMLEAAIGERLKKSLGE